ncbi:hypothetical protein QVD17_00227 [Tagetes erecta]|uniref:Uncharacterized protein n=1 Tax=Tagetes erecta TaxID=13708 RepID=A0AAD8L5E3_TARER|nr:hypothetical protein QVD17_00227 [Tagetes erecta]
MMLGHLKGPELRHQPKEVPRTSKQIRETEEINKFQQIITAGITVAMPSIITGVTKAVFGECMHSTSMKRNGTKKETSSNLILKKYGVILKPEEVGNEETFSEDELPQTKDDVDVDVDVDDDSEKVYDDCANKYNDDNVDWKNESKVDISVVPDEVSKRKEHRPKRKLSQMAKILVSAYEDRKVEVEDEVTALEKNITAYLFAGIGDEWYVYLNYM